MLCNVYLHRLDRAWSVSEHGVLVRYVDDAVVMCDTREQAEAALAQLTDLLAGLGLEPKAAKTRIVRLAEGNPGFDFLGFHHRLVRGRPGALAPSTSPDGPTQGCPACPRPGPGDHRPGTAAGPAEVFVRNSTCSCAAGPATPLRKLGLCPGQVRRYALRRLGLLSKKGNRRQAAVGHRPDLPVAGPGQLPRAPSSRPGPSGTGGGRPNTAGEERR